MERAGKKSNLTQKCVVGGSMKISGKTFWGKRNFVKMYQCGSGETTFESYHPSAAPLDELWHVLAPPQFSFFPISQVLHRSKEKLLRQKNVPREISYMVGCKRETKTVTR